MEDEIYTVDTEVKAYRTLREHADNIEEAPSDMNVSDYDALVEIDDETYGVEFDGAQAKAEKALREAGAVVDGARERRGSKSGGIVSETMARDMTVEQAVNDGLEPGEERNNGEDLDADTGSTNLRYGLNKVQSE